MGVEIYIWRPDEDPGQPLGDYLRRLTEAGYPCREEADEWGQYIVFEGRESVLIVSLDDEGALCFATFAMSSTDPPEFVEEIERFFVDDGWSIGPDE